MCPCRKRLKLSWEVDECKPLHPGQLRRALWRRRRRRMGVPPPRVQVQPAVDEGRGAHPPPPLGGQARVRLRARRLLPLAGPHTVSAPPPVTSPLAALPRVVSPLAATPPVTSPLAAPPPVTPPLGAKLPRKRVRGPRQRCRQKTVETHVVCTTEGCGKAGGSLTATSRSTLHLLRLLLLLLLLLFLLLLLLLLLLLFLLLLLQLICVYRRTASARRYKR